MPICTTLNFIHPFSQLQVTQRNSKSLFFSQRHQHRPGSAGLRSDIIILEKGILPWEGAWWTQWSSKSHLSTSLRGWQAALNLHYTEPVRVKGDHPTPPPPPNHLHLPPFTWAVRIGVNQQSDLRWENPEKKKERDPLPTQLLLLQITEHYMWNDILSSSSSFRSETLCVIKKQQMSLCSINGDLH